MTPYIAVSYILRRHFLPLSLTGLVELSIDGSTVFVVVLRMYPSITYSERSGRPAQFVLIWLNSRYSIGIAGCRGCPDRSLRFETWHGRPAAACDLRRAGQAAQGPGPEREREPGRRERDGSSRGTELCILAQAG